MATTGFFGDSGNSGGYSIGVSQPSVSGGGGDSFGTNPAFGGYPGNSNSNSNITNGPYAGTNLDVDPTSPVYWGFNTNTWGQQQPQQHDIFNQNDNNIVGVGGGGLGTGATIPADPSTSASFYSGGSDGGGGSYTNTRDNNNYNNNIVPEWRRHPGGNSFSFAPKTSIVVLGAFFGLAALVLTRATKSFRHGILLASSLTLTASIGFVFDLEEPPWVSCQDVWEKNLGIGVVFGLILAYSVWFLQRIITNTSTQERDRRAFVESAVPLQGTIVQKSSTTRRVGDQPKTFYMLHILHDPETRGMPPRAHHSSTNNDGFGHDIELSKLPSSNNLEDLPVLRQAAASTTLEDDRFLIPMPSPRDMDNGGDTAAVASCQISTDVDKQHCQDETATVTAATTTITTTTIYPFSVVQDTYDESQIGDSIELLCLPENPFAVRVKSEAERQSMHPAEMLCLFFFFIPGFLYPLAIGLGLYLPIRVLNWSFCRNSVIVCLSSMAITSALLLYSCCGCFVPKDSVTLAEVREMIREGRARNTEKERDEELKALVDTALADLEDKVARAMNGDDKNNSGSTENCRLSRSEAYDLMHNTLFQAEVSAGRDIPNLTVESSLSPSGFVARQRWTSLV